MLFYFNSDDDTSNRVNWIHTYTYTQSSGRWQTTRYAYVFRTEMKNEFFIAEKASVCRNSNGVCKEDSKSWNLNPKNNWTCYDYLDRESGNCKITPLTKQTLVAPKNGASITVNYDIDNSPDNAPECTCREWYVAITDQNNKDCFHGFIGCNSDKSIILAPNNDNNQFYTISARLHSYRKSK